MNHFGGKMYDRISKQIYLEDLITVSKILNVSPEDLLECPEDYEKLFEEVHFDIQNEPKYEMIILPTFEVDNESEK
jgi:hypothetical protein